jgi:hypothetical protein
MESLEFFIDLILLAVLRPWGRLSLHRNEYQEYFLGGKDGRCVRLTTLAPTCADCLKIWEPQPSGTVRACPGPYRDSFTFFTLMFPPPPPSYLTKICKHVTPSQCMLHILSTLSANPTGSCDFP